tara:strand:+ start:1090 stop:1242 length:153 start_codon:yes stop_codon:yes gene_type:complete
LIRLKYSLRTIIDKIVIKTLKERLEYKTAIVINEAYNNPDKKRIQKFFIY